MKVHETCLAYLLAVTLTIGGGLTGCTPGKRPFQLVQICLEDASGLEAFKSELQSIARDEGMRFVAGSAAAKKDLQVLNSRGEQQVPASAVIDISVEGDSGMGLGAGNVELPPYQVAIGFSEGSDREKARKFARRVLNRMANRWRVHPVPVGRGAQPLDCGTAA